MSSQDINPENINDFDSPYDATIGDGSLNTNLDSLNDIRPGVNPNPESESKDESESGFDSGFGIMCSVIGFGVGIV